MAVTIAAAGKNFPVHLLQTCSLEYNWVATAPQVTTFNTDAKRRVAAKDLVCLRAEFRTSDVQVEQCLASFSGAV